MNKMILLIVEGKKRTSTTATTGGGSPLIVFPEDLHVTEPEAYRAAYAGANCERGAKGLTSGPDTSMTLVPFIGRSEASH